MCYHHQLVIIEIASVKPTAVICITWTMCSPTLMSILMRTTSILIKCQSIHETLLGMPTESGSINLHTLGDPTAELIKVQHS